jgi:hypothetical protein
MHTFAKYTTILFLILCSICVAMSLVEIFEGNFYFILPLFLNAFAVYLNYQGYKRIKDYETNVG